MRTPRMMIGWLLLVLLAVVGGGGAALGIVQSPKAVPLDLAVYNTLSAANYSEVLTQATAQGSESDYLTFQAPDRLGGYIQSGNRRTYVYVIGTTEYQSLTVSSTTPPDHLVFYTQPVSGAKALDPAQGYLPYVSQGKNIQQSGDTYSFSLTRQGEVAKFVLTVTGKFVSEFSFKVSSASVQLLISQVGTSPPVALPAGSRVVGASGGTSGSASGGTSGSASSGNSGSAG